MNPPTDSVQFGDDVSPNLAYDQTENLLNPKFKMTARQRKAAMRARQNRYVRVGQGVKSASPGEKYIIKLASLTMHQLIRRLKQAARLASHFKHEADKQEKNNPGSFRAPKFRALQQNALACFTHIDTEIEFRTKAE